MTLMRRIRTALEAAGRELVGERTPRQTGPAGVSQHAVGHTANAIGGDVWATSANLPGYSAPAAGTYATYRRMRGNPTIAIARMAATAPIRAARIAVSPGIAPAPGMGSNTTHAQAVAFIDANIRPLWPAICRDAMLALDYGWKGFEKVYVHDAGRLVLHKLKPLAPELTRIQVDPATGGFAGLEQRGVSLPAGKCFVYSYDPEDDGLYGRSRHENVRAAWAAWTDLLAKEGQYATKVAGVTPIVTYPEGVGRDRHGAERPNFELAQAVLANLGLGHGVAMPNRLAGWAEDLVRGGIDVSQLAAWQIRFLEPSGQHGQDLVRQMQHKESLMLRGWLVPERAVAEGHAGTRADAEQHADLALSIAQETLDDLLRCVNRHVVDPLLALNFGEAARGSVRLTASPIADAGAGLARAMLLAAMGSPPNAETLLRTLDLDAMVEQQGLPGVKAKEREEA
ncbi:MAG: hypothetical protein NTW19_02495 [Planctomycetota bacterium]|nr:hypothetical protein [Planctomycetota bacterium]